MARNEKKPSKVVKRKTALSAKSRKKEPLFVWPPDATKDALTEAGLANLWQVADCGELPQSVAYSVKLAVEECVRARIIKAALIDFRAIVETIYVQRPRENDPQWDRLLDAINAAGKAMGAEPEREEDMPRPDKAIPASLAAAVRAYVDAEDDDRVDEWDVMVAALERAEAESCSDKATLDAWHVKRIGELCERNAELHERIAELEAQRPANAVPYEQQSAEWRAGYDEAAAVAHTRQADLRRQLRDARAHRSTKVGIGSHDHIAFWEAVNAYAAARGGDMGLVTNEIHEAVVRVERAVVDFHGVPYADQHRAKLKVCGKPGPSPDFTCRLEPHEGVCTDFDWTPSPTNAEQKVDSSYPDEVTQAFINGREVGRREGLCVGDTVTVASHALFKYRHRTGVIRELKGPEARVEIDGILVDRWFYQTDLHRIPVETWTDHGKEIKALQTEVLRWRSLYLDKPEDRLYHASDNTWWRRDDTRPGGVGSLVRADPPPGWVDKSEER